MLRSIANSTPFTKCCWRKKAIVHMDDHEEEVLQSDDETGKDGDDQRSANLLNTVTDLKVPPEGFDLEEASPVPRIRMRTEVWSPPHLEWTQANYPKHGDRTSSDALNCEFVDCHGVRRRAGDQLGLDITWVVTTWRYHALAVPLVTAAGVAARASHWTWL